jgi:tetratricopeptide (TPR) repeat protein
VFPNKKSLIFLIFYAISLSLWGGSSYDQAVEAYRLSQFDKAESALQTALAEEPAQDRNHLLLGAVYQKLNRADKAEEILLQGINLNGANKENLTFNLANLYYSQNKKEEALTLYSEIAGGLSSFGSGAVLNRGNCYLSLSDFPGALDDYIQYLKLEPTTPQRPEIEKMIALLQDKIASEEERQRLAAQQRALDEQRRLEEEKRAAEEAAKQQALLDEILASLENVSGDTQVISAGSEDIVIDDEDSDIEE